MLRYKTYFIYSHLYRINCQKCTIQVLLHEYAQNTRTYNIYTANIIFTPSNIDLLRAVIFPKNMSTLQKAFGARIIKFNKAFVLLVCHRQICQTAEILIPIQIIYRVSIDRERERERARAIDTKNIEVTFFKLNGESSVEMISDTFGYILLLLYSR